MGTVYLRGLRGVQTNHLHLCWRIALQALFYPSSSNTSTQALESYQTMSDIPSVGYTHQTVNHSQNLVSPCDQGMYQQCEIEG